MGLTPASQFWFCFFHVSCWFCKVQELKLIQQCFFLLLTQHSRVIDLLSKNSPYPHFLYFLGTVLASEGLNVSWHLSSITPL